MGYVLIVGRPSGVRRQAFCRLIKEPVAVPSRSRSEGALEFGQKALRLLLALAEGRPTAGAGYPRSHAFPLATRDPVAPGLSGRPSR
jgi:hypothetical protein